MSAAQAAAATPASVDIFQEGGGVAQRLLANDFDERALRTNATLRKDEWIQLDRTVKDVARRRLSGFNDLISRRLVFRITDGLGTTVLQYEDMTDMTAATVSMDAATKGDRDRPEFNLNSLPLPIVHKDFQLNIRQLRSSRKLGLPLDTTMARTAATLVSEKIEDILFNGLSAYAFGGGTIRGYTDHPNRNTVAVGTDWLSDTPANILSDVLAMKQALSDDRHHGPFMLYIPQNYERLFDDDYYVGTVAQGLAAPNTTLRARVMAIDQIEGVRVSDFLTASNVLLVQMDTMTVRAVIGMQPRTLEWDIEGGMILNFKVMAIMVPQMRADADGRMGLAHLS